MLALNRPWVGHDHARVCARSFDGASGPPNLVFLTGRTVVQPPFTEQAAEQAWQARYRLVENGHMAEPSWDATCARVALALSAPEPTHRDDWQQRFDSELRHFRFLPGGRILAGAGSARQLTLFNCFVLGALHDSIGGIFSALTEAMLTVQAGAGAGCDFSPLRPKGMAASGTGALASGPVSFLRLWDKACATLSATRARRGELMVTLRCDHPDIERFIDARRGDNVLRHVRLAVLVTDAFLGAVERGDPWPLVFPLAPGQGAPAGAAVLERMLPGSTAMQACVVQGSVPARALWERLTRAAFDSGDPGVLFIDRIERSNNLYYAESIAACDPGAAVPLPAHGASSLGAVNLAGFVTDPFGDGAALDLEKVAATAAIATRMLDNVYEVSPYPLKAQQHAARASRRIGLGITGLADAFAMLGVGYGSRESLDIAARAMQAVCYAAYSTSVGLARERGAFPAYRAPKYLDAPFIRALPQDLLEAIDRDGIRNSHLTAIAPGAFTSLLANNVSAGTEPVHMLEGMRRLHARDGSELQTRATDYALAQFRLRHGQAELPASLAGAADAGPGAQLRVQAAVQPFVDQSITARLTASPDAAYGSCSDAFRLAYELGLKGCTLCRATPPAAAQDGAGAPHPVPYG